MNLAKKVFIYSSFLLFLSCSFYLAIQGVLLVRNSVDVVASYAESLPQPKIEERLGEPSRIFDREGNFLYEIHGDIRRKNVDLEDVPDYVSQAFIAAEDHDFYVNTGVSMRNIVASIQSNLKEEEIERGASTITMQLAKNLALTDEKTLDRKVKEIIIALLITTRYSKDQILERYLNEAPVGGNLVGIAAAAETYFQKPVNDLTIKEGATIAALINAPSRLSPYDSQQNLEERTIVILEQMVDLGFLPRTVAEEAKREELTFAPDIETITFPYFVMYIKDFLFDRYGKEAVEYGGLKVYTSLDPNLQQIAEAKVKEFAQKNKDQWQANDAALITMDPKNGQILTMVGGNDYWDSQVNVVTSKRQPGSSIKPFIYYSAFVEGYSDKTYILDTVRDFGGGYKPENYGGGATGKWWSIRHSLIQSLNIPAVAALEKTGVGITVQRLKDMGFSSLDPTYPYGLSFALGSAEITPLEMATGASVLATTGKKVTPVAILKIEKNDGNVVINNEWISSNEQLADFNSVALVNDIISDYTTKKAFYNTEWYKNYSLSDRPAAAKTGTSSGPRDAWLVGYTPNLVTIVWTGNNDGTLMKDDADGINVAAPLWDSYMEEVITRYPIETFPKPQEVDLDKEHKQISPY